jgi:hypothetical protein
VNISSGDYHSTHHRGAPIKIEPIHVCQTHLTDKGYIKIKATRRKIGTDAKAMGKEKGGERQRERRKRRKRRKKKGRNWNGREEKRREEKRKEEKRRGEERKREEKKREEREKKREGNKKLREHICVPGFS